MSQLFRGSPGGGAIGNVIGTPPTVDNAIARYDGVTGLIIQNSDIIIDDDGNLDAQATFTGSTKFFLLQNNDNTAGSSSKISQLVGGTSAGDVYDEFSIGAARAYAFGVDNDDSQTFKLTTDAAANVDPSSGTTLIDVTSGGEISFPAATLTQFGVMVVGASGLLTSTAVGSAGEVLTSNGAGLAPTYQTFSSLSWVSVTGAAQALAVSTGYVGNRPTDITYTLPAVAAFGDVIRILNIGVGKTIIAQGPGQSINLVASTTTVGAGGTLSAVEQFAEIELVCTVANTTFNARVSGNWTVV